MLSIFHHSHFANMAAMKDDSYEGYEEGNEGQGGGTCCLSNEEVNNIAIQNQVINHLHKLSLNDLCADFLAIALQGGKVGFEKITQMIDKLTHELKIEQAEDDAKENYCKTELDKAEDNKNSQEAGAGKGSFV